MSNWIGAAATALAGVLGVFGGIYTTQQSNVTAADLNDNEYIMKLGELSEGQKTQSRDLGGFQARLDELVDDFDAYREKQPVGSRLIELEAEVAALRATAQDFSQQLAQQEQTGSVVRAKDVARILAQEYAETLRGPQGNTGATGQKGDRGDRGFSGSNGERGEPGQHGSPSQVDLDDVVDGILNSKAFVDRLIAAVPQASREASGTSGKVVIKTAPAGQCFDLEDSPQTGVRVFDGASLCHKGSTYATANLMRGQVGIRFNYFNGTHSSLLGPGSIKFNTPNVSIFVSNIEHSQGYFTASFSKF